MDLTRFLEYRNMVSVRNSKGLVVLVNFTASELPAISPIVFQSSLANVN